MLVLHTLILLVHLAKQMYIVGNHHFLHTVDTFTNFVSPQDSIPFGSIFVKSPMSHKVPYLNDHMQQYVGPSKAS